MDIFGIAITVLAAILTYQAWKNGRWMKLAHQDTQDLIREMHKDTAESFRKMDETIRELGRKTDESIMGLGKLIVADGEKTRQMIKV